MKKVLLLPLMFFIISIPAYAQATYEVALTGVEKVPSVRTPAMGNLEVWVDSDSLYVRGAFYDLRGSYWAAHVHFGKRGENGNRLFRLNVSELDEDHRNGEFRSEENAFALRPAQRQALRNGNLYIVISSNRFQQGEIRGQIPRM